MGRNIDRLAAMGAVRSVLAPFAARTCVQEPCGRGRSRNTEADAQSQRTALGRIARAKKGSE